jgi:hypothetical protein
MLYILNSILRFENNRSSDNKIKFFVYNPASLKDFVF